MQHVTAHQFVATCVLMLGDICVSHPFLRRKQDITVLKYAVCLNTKIKRGTYVGKLPGVITVWIWS